MFKQATKTAAKLRLALCGPAGSGKTYSALRLGTALAEGGKIAVVDTERGSASKYADLFAFDVMAPETFDPRQLIEAIDYAEKNGYSVLIADSLSHYWMGTGGELEMVDAVAKRDSRGNSFAAWKSITPIHNKLIEKIIGAKLHVIATMRTKTEWVLETNDKGKQVPRKVGLAPVMRDGIEFEFDVCGDLDQDNSLVVTKSRCPALSGKVINQPGPEMAETLKTWLRGSVTQPAAPRKAPASVTTCPDCGGGKNPTESLCPGCDSKAEQKARAEFSRREAEKKAEQPAPTTEGASERMAKSSAQAATEIKECRTLFVQMGVKTTDALKTSLGQILGYEVTGSLTALSNDERGKVLAEVRRLATAEEKAAANG